MDVITNFILNLVMYSEAMLVPFISGVYASSKARSWKKKYDFPKYATIPLLTIITTFVLTIIVFVVATIIPSVVPDAFTYIAVTLASTLVCSGLFTIMTDESRFRARGEDTSDQEEENVDNEDEWNWVDVDLHASRWMFFPVGLFLMTTISVLQETTTAKSDVVFPFSEWACGVIGFGRLLIGGILIVSTLMMLGWFALLSIQNVPELVTAFMRFGKETYGVMGFMVVLFIGNMLIVLLTLHAIIFHFQFLVAYVIDSLIPTIMGYNPWKGEAPPTCGGVLR